MLGHRKGAQRRMTGVALAAALAVGAWLYHAPQAAAAAIDVAITFDDLPGGAAEVDAVLQALARRGWTGVAGFVNGGQIRGTEADPSLQRWVAAGQRLGNHTYSHADLQQMRTEAYLDDLQRNEAVLEAVTHERQSWKIFRYPFLFEGRSPHEYRTIRQALDAAGYSVAQVTIDPYDWAWDGAFNRCRQKGDAQGMQAVQADFVRDALAQLRWADQSAQALLGRPIPHVLLLHMRSLAAATLDTLLDAFVAAGVRFVPLDAALADTAYKTDAANWGPVNGTFLRQLTRAYPSPGVTAPPPHPMRHMDTFCAD